MGVFASLSTGIDTLRRNPLIVGLVLVYSTVGAAISSLQSIDPLLVYPAYFALLFVIPFFLGGIIGTIHDGLRGRSTLNRFVSAGTSGYLSIFGGGVLLMVVSGLLYFVVFLVGIFVAAFALGMSGMGTTGLGGLSGGATALAAIVSLLGLLLIVLPWFVLQFFPAAVVVDDLGLVDSFKRSGGLVKTDFLSVLGFDAIAFLIGLVAQVPTVYLFYRTTNASPGFAATGSMYDALSTTELGIYLGLTVLFGTLVGSVSQAYYVAYYDHFPSPGRPDRGNSSPRTSDIHHET